MMSGGHVLRLNSHTHVRLAAGNCNSAVAAQYSTPVNLTYGSLMAWGNRTAQLLYERPAAAALHKCAGAAGSADPLGGLSCGELQQCLPCYCSGLQQLYRSKSPSESARQHLGLFCSEYLNEFDLG